MLFAPEVEPISERLERIEATSEGQTLIAEGVGGIYTILKRAPQGDLIHLVNLVEVDNARWRDTAGAPALQESVALRYRSEDGRTVSEVLWATPDAGSGVFSPLAFTTGDGYIDFEVPRLAYWDVVLVRYDE